MNFQIAVQETRYAGIRDLCHASGKAADYAGRSFDDFDLKPFLEKVLPALPLSCRTGVRALEYGTGPGAVGATETSTFIPESLKKPLAWAT